MHVQFDSLPISPTLEAKSRPCWSVSACLDMMANRLFPWTRPVDARIRNTHADTHVKVADFIVELPIKKKNFVIIKTLDLIFVRNIIGHINFAHFSIVYLILWNIFLSKM